MLLLGHSVSWRPNGQASPARRVCSVLPCASHPTTTTLLPNSSRD